MKRAVWKIKWQKRINYLRCIPMPGVNCNLSQLDLHTLYTLYSNKRFNRATHTHTHTHRQSAERRAKNLENKHSLTMIFPHTLLSIIFLFSCLWTPLSVCPSDLFCLSVCRTDLFCPCSHIMFLTSCTLPMTSDCRALLWSVTTSGFNVWLSQ